MKRDERSLGHGTTSRADLGMVKGGGKGVGGVHLVCKAVGSKFVVAQALVIFK